MKKKLFFAATAFALAAFPASVHADPALTLVKTFTSEDWLDISWVYGTNLLCQGNMGTTRLLSTEGEPITDYLYDYSLYGHNGMVIVRLADESIINRYGLLDAAGKEILPCSYGQIDAYSENWIIASVMTEGSESEYDLETGPHYLLIDSVDIYYLENGAANKIATLTRDEMGDYYASGKYISIENRTDHTVTMYDSSFQEAASGLQSLYDDAGLLRNEYNIYWEADKSGIKDPDGNILLETDYEFISEVAGDYVLVSDDGKYGLIDFEGNVIVPAQCDDILSIYTGDGYTYVSAGYICAEVEGKFAFYDLDGNVTLKPEYSIDSVDAAGASALMTDAEGKVHILAGDGTDTLLDDKYLNPCVIQGSCGLLYTYDSPDSDYGIIDWHGNEVLPAPQGYSLGLSMNGKWLVTSPDYNTVNLYSVEYGIPAMDEQSGSQEAPAEAVSEQVEADTDIPADADAADTSADVPAEDETQAAAASAADAPAEETPAETEISAGTEPAASAEDASGEADLSSVKSLIDTVLTLVNVDFEGNLDSILALLTSAKTQLAAQPAALSILDSVITLLNSGAADGSSIASLLQSLSLLLG